MQIDPLSPVFFLILPIFWCVICFHFSLIGGWSSLASHYGFSKGKSELDWNGWKSITVRRNALLATRYSGTVKMAFCDDTLYLSMFLLFRVGHSTLKLPYSEMTMETKKLLFSEALIVKMRKEQSVRLIFSGEEKKQLSSMINA